MENCKIGIRTSTHVPTFPRREHFVTLAFSVISPSPGAEERGCSPMNGHPRETALAYDPSKVYICISLPV